MSISWIERLSQRWGVIPTLKSNSPLPKIAGDLKTYPPCEQWDDLVVPDPSNDPDAPERRARLVPTTCFNCESACGLLAYVDKDSQSVIKFEGNPMHPGSRGRNCAKGPATLNQIQDPDRILEPQKRVGVRGSGEWESVSWDQALTEIGDKIRASLATGRRDRVVYHVGRPGYEGSAERVLKAWGVDGHNSHTNICSAGARTGYALWHKQDRPSPDHAHARTILLLSSHLETGHYFNPHAQRIMEGKMKGAKLIVMDPRLSNTASLADIWLPTHPGTETNVLLAIARYLLEADLVDHSFMRDWVNWRQYLEHLDPTQPAQYERFIEVLRREYAPFTLDQAAAEAGIELHQLEAAAKAIGDAGRRLATHVWRGPSIGNLGGWQVSRALHFLNVLTGSVGTRGGTSPNGWNKFHPHLIDDPPKPQAWNELHFPPEYTLCHYEMSQILPHMIRQGRGAMDVYFTRVFNPVWTYPDGFSWIEMLLDETAVGCHVAMTPTWNETAFFADYVLPMGHASERHDLNSYETQAGVWIAFRQPVLRESARRDGREVKDTREINPGQVWEEDEFWIALSWRIDPDGKLGIRKHFESPDHPGTPLSVDEYYRHIFQRTPGLTDAAQKEGLDELTYMRQYGAFLVEDSVYERHLETVEGDEQGLRVESGRVFCGDQAVGVEINGKKVRGFDTPSGLQEFFSATMIDFGYPEHAIPQDLVRSHVHPGEVKRDQGEMVLLPNFRLPVHIHSRSANAKWLVEIAHRNPVWLNTLDAERLGVETGDLIKVCSEIGWLVDKVWVCEAIKPGIVACSHHLGRWRREGDRGNQWMTNRVELSRTERGWLMRTVAGVQAWESSDRDSRRIWWRDAGVHQNLIHAVQPDPISGAHCWLQKVRLELPQEHEAYGDVFVDRVKSQACFERWNQLAKDRECHPGGLRRPLWFKRPLTPEQEWFMMPTRPEGSGD